ncbi:molybdenum cofactor guanylyltransferase MobA [Orbaceae bacterium ESL0727]|nr:molybdenum cofactor guanylyltransferase MobA [Orbaceae bacterium ESL0727]
MKNSTITAIILAGGQGSRMNGQDKGLVNYQNRPLYQHVSDRIKPQVGAMMISCNRHIDQYNTAGYPVFIDDFAGYLGPLSGIYSGLLRSQTDWNLFVSCDTPFLPDDLVSRLVNAISTQFQSSQSALHHLAAYVFDGERHHPTLLLIHKQALLPLKQYLEQGDRKLMLFLQQIEAIAVNFSDEKASFVNMNTLADLQHN